MENKTCEKGIEQDVRSNGININLGVLSVKIGHGVVVEDLGFDFRRLEIHSFIHYTNIIIVSLA